MFGSAVLLTVAASAPTLAEGGDKSVQHILDAFSTFKSEPEARATWSPCVAAMESSRERHWTAIKNSGAKFAVRKAGESAFHLGKVYYLLATEDKGGARLRIACHLTDAGDVWKIEKID